MCLLEYSPYLFSLYRCLQAGSHNLYSHAEMHHWHSTAGRTRTGPSAIAVVGRHACSLKCCLLAADRRGGWFQEQPGDYQVNRGPFVQLSTAIPYCSLDTPATWWLIVPRSRHRDQSIMIPASRIPRACLSSRRLLVNIPSSSQTRLPRSIHSSRVIRAPLTTSSSSALSAVRNRPGLSLGGGSSSRRTLASVASQCVLDLKSRLHRPSLLFHRHCHSSLRPSHLRWHDR